MVGTDIDDMGFLPVLGAGEGRQYKMGTRGLLRLELEQTQRTLTQLGRDIEEKTDHLRTLWGMHLQEQLKAHGTTDSSKASILGSFAERKVELYHRVVDEHYRVVVGPNGSGSDVNTFT